MIRVMILLAALAALPLPVLAHKVIFGVFPSGDAIEGELGFSSGDPSVDQIIEVFDPEGKKLGETVTDADGFFVFVPSEPVAHVFRTNLGAGHTAEVDMPAAEVAAILGVAAEVAEMKAETIAVPAPTGGVTVASLSTEEKLAIAEAVRREIRPLRQEIAAYRERNDLQTVLGGIGYIAGLFGVGFYVAARRRMGA